MQFACSTSDLRPDEPIVVTVDGREIVLVQTGDEIFALRNICPHQGQSFMSGVVRPQLSCADPDGPVTVDPGNPALLCPWHTWGYSLRDGQCTSDPRFRVASYDVSVEGDRVLVGPRGSS